MSDYNQLKNAAILTPTQNTSLGSDENRYTDVYLSGNVNVGGATINSTNAIAPRIASITYSGDDTATATAGGGTVTINGSGFRSGAVVYVAGTIASQVSFVDSTTVTFVAPAKAAGNYELVLVNSDGASATYIPRINYSGTPSWSTASGSLGTVDRSTVFSSTIAATSDSTVTYSVVSGALPSGLSLDIATGVISGTAPNVSVNTTYNFTIRATDSENQETDRTFSISVQLPIAKGQVAYTTPGTYSWTVPAEVTSVSMVLIGGGGGGADAGVGSAGGGGGGGLRYYNALSVTPGETLSVTVGAGGAYYSYTGGLETNVKRGATTLLFAAGGAAGRSGINPGGGGGTTIGGSIGGGNGGAGGGYGGGSPAQHGGGAGAGGYSGNGGNGGDRYYGSVATAGTGGAGGGGAGTMGTGANGGPGGGVGLLGQGSNGTAGAGTSGEAGGAGSSGSGQTYGGGGPTKSAGADGAVRIIWGPGRAFPSTLTTDQ